MLSTMGRVLTEVADVREPAQVMRFVDNVQEIFGQIDVLVNNAGIVSVGAFVDEPYESISSVIDVNLKGTMYMTRAVLPSMIARYGGVIINVSSGAELSGFPGSSTIRSLVARRIGQNMRASFCSSLVAARKESINPYIISWIKRRIASIKQSWR